MIELRILWVKVTKGRAGVRWDSIVEKVWKARGKPAKVVSAGRFWEVQGRGRRKDRNKGKASATKQGGIGKKNI